MTTSLSSFTLPAGIFQNAPASVLLPIVLGNAVGLSTRPYGAKNIYQTIKQPPLSPPPYAFGPVWTVLYGLMGYAAHRVATVGLSPLASPALALATRHSLAVYTAQLGLNLAWMPIFFVARRPDAATLASAALFGLNAWLVRAWAPVDALAAWLQLPYLAWLAYATYLSGGVGYLNDWDISKPVVNKDE